MKLRVLFVDDEVNILEAFRRRLRSRRDQWDMRYASGGEEALTLLADSPCDVIVSDMRMPGMDGATLLERVRARYPATARIVLSGYAEPEAVLRAMAVAQQFLPKPCEPKLLETTIERVGGLQAAINDDAVLAAVGRISCLPSPPVIYDRLLATLADGHTSMGDVAQILHEDGAMCAQMLHIANSTFCGIGRPIDSVDQALTYLGLDTVRQLVLVAGVFRQAEGMTSQQRQTFLALQRHSLLAGSIASGIMADDDLQESAFIAALLHDIGNLLLLCELPERGVRLTAGKCPEDASMHAAEKRLFGVTHAEIGGYLLGLWRLPFPIVEAVALHHEPAGTATASLSLLVAVHVADCLAGELCVGPADSVMSSDAQLDLELLDRLGVGGRLSGWRAMANERAEAILGAVPL